MPCNRTCSSLQPACQGGSLQPYVTESVTACGRGAGRVASDNLHRAAAWIFAVAASVAWGCRLYWPRITRLASVSAPTASPPRTMSTPRAK